MKILKKKAPCLAKLIFPSCFMILIFACFNAQAAEFYDIDTVNTIYITFEESNWDQLLDELYAAGAEERLEGTAVINGITYENVGVRYKGNSSYRPEQIKNPLNIKLDYINEDQTLYGYGTLKLANVYNDPSFVREVLSYEIARKYMPASQANFIDVYINGTHIGLYTSVQDVDKLFLENHFGSKNNPFFKGDAEDIFDSADVWGYLGENEADYYEYYDIKSDDGWDKLINFFDVFNNSTSQVEDVLDVDRLLWMLAFDILTVNLDSPVNVAHNFYLYQDEAGRFNPIIWDLNENFGAFSMLINGPPLNISNMQQLDPFLNEDDPSYPILNQILTNDTYRKMYVAHMKTIIEENFEDDWYINRAFEIQDIIGTYVQDDENKLYTYDDFLNNVENSSGFRANEIIGIAQLMSSRVPYIQSLYEFQASAPIISEITPPTDAASNSTVRFTAQVDDAELVQLGYRQSGGFVKVPMFDDGNHQDGAENDGLYGVSISIGSGDLDYYIYAENSSAAAFSPMRAEYEFYTAYVTDTPGSIVINEFMADNQSSVTDQNDEYDDWIELYNNTDTDISLEGWYLSDDAAEPNLWVFPDVSIPANGYLIVWADKDEKQDGLHADFKLSASGETILLSSPDLTLMDQVDFEEQSPDLSMARFPNGTGEFTQMTPTFLAENTLISGDLNDDGIVDLSDLNILKQFFRQSSDNCEECDLDNDGIITIRDARTLISMCTCTNCNCD
nr:CotH kinase family protein [uncultured Desulfobacter sp.]